jgi:flagellar biosynthesis protein FlhB
VPAQALETGYQLAPQSYHPIERAHSLYVLGGFEEPDRVDLALVLVVLGKGHISEFLSPSQSSLTSLSLNIIMTSLSPFDTCSRIFSVAGLSHSHSSKAILQVVLFLGSAINIIHLPYILIGRWSSVNFFTSKN